MVHTRLAIIDVDPRSSQPFHDGPLALIFNGEIYNYVELRQDLEAAGEAFRTTSDTEVLARLLRRGGAAACDRLEGMWAFAAADASSGTVVLSRDRFGEKPLLLWRRPEGLYFASEVKALAALVGRWPEPDLDRLTRFIALGYKSLHKQPGTFFADVEELPAASSLVIGPGAGERRIAYWRLDHRPVAMSRADAVDGVRTALVESLRLRLRSDVPLAFCLSGGVDSGALASIASRTFGAQVEAFTVVDANPHYDERANAARVVEAIGCRWHTVAVSDPGSFDLLEALVASHDKPVVTIASFVEARLAAAMAEHGFKVAISGVGADELFTGYYDHYLFWLAERAAEDPDRFDALVADWRKTYGAVVRNPHLQNPRVFADDPSARGHVYLNADAFAARLRRPVDTAFRERTCTTASLLRNRMLNEVAEETIPIMLAESDANFMRVSIENRSPFLDRRLAEFAFTIPSEHLVQDGRPKSVLRDAVAGLLDEQVRTDPVKRGFNATLTRMIDGRDARVRDRVLGLRRIYDLVDRAAVEELLARPELPNSWQKFLFAVVSSGVFLDQLAARSAAAAEVRSRQTA